MKIPSDLQKVAIPFNILTTYYLLLTVQFTTCNVTLYAKHRNKCKNQIFTYLENVTLSLSCSLCSLRP